MVVEWGDAFIETHDFDPKEAAGTEPIWRKTVGFLITENKHGYVLATDEYNDPKAGVAARMFVPHGMVRSVTVLIPS